MKVFVLLFVAGLANAGRLERTYLPPTSAATASGAEFVEAPVAINGAYKVHGQTVANIGGYYHGSAAHAGQQIAITRYDNQQNIGGSYRYSYETANGISAEEIGTPQTNAEAVSGSYSYTGPDGVQYSVRYVADENGFHAEGAHLPTPPPIPEEILRGVELSLAAEARGENQEGQYRPEIHRVNNKYQSLVVPTAAGSSSGYHY